MDNISLLVKPASGLCNMSCRYCFYRDEMEHIQTLKMKLMSEEVMERLIESVCSEAKSRIHITFQGGEPTLAGLPFFRSFAALMQKRKKRGTAVTYALQTNGLLLDEEWAVFLSDHSFLVGLSFDGTPRIHDASRTDQNGGTAGRVEAAWRLLREHGVAANLLCVVTGQAARKPQQVYRYLRGMGAEYLQFIPCISPSGAHESASWELKPEQYAYFLKAIFDLWYRDLCAGDYVSIRQLDDYVQLLHGRYPSSCAAFGQCGGYFLVENDGSVYPCDFFVTDEWRLGNILDTSFEELAHGAKMTAFLTEEYMPESCGRCEYYALCRGGCKNDCRVVPESGGIRENIFCGAYREFFRYAQDRLCRL